jgi:hypothetical protein
MVDRIGVRRRWIQKEGTVYEHFDICLSKRALAIKAGAVEIDMHGLAAIFKARKGEHADAIRPDAR